jgi:pyrimidine operon attenuation protein/uracil phosphoribosyltransferase
MSPAEKSIRVMDADYITRTLNRIAYEILEKNRTLDDLALVGIRSRGVPLARRLAGKLKEITGSEPPVGELDINLYRDDLSRIAYHPVLKTTEIPFEIDDKVVVLVDDVLFTGRTIRSALNAIMDLGRPSWVQLGVLVDRGHRELPVRADYIGKNVATSKAQDVIVRLTEIDEEDEVVIVDPVEGAS